MSRMVVFDFDGTLVDSNAIKRQAFYEAGQVDDRAAAVLDDIFARRQGLTRHGVFAELGRRLHPGDPIAARDAAEEWVARYAAVTGERVARCPEVAGAEAVMDALAGDGWRLALNSATPTEALESIVEQRGWRHRFRHVLGAPAGKADNLRRIAAREGVAVETLIMVGDGDDDRAAAQTVGCHFVAIDRGEGRFTMPPPVRLAALEGLPEALARLG